MDLSHELRVWIKRPVGRTTLGTLLLAISTAILSAGIFISIALQVGGKATLAQDGGILLGINGMATPSLDYLIVGLTSLGDMVAVGALTAGLFALLALRRRWWSFWLVVAAMTGAALLNVGLKLLFARERPRLWEQLILESSYSFPSGHAMMTVVLALIIILLTWRSRYRWPVALLSISYTGTIGFSRLYLGVHYPTDVVAGWCAGVAVVAGAFIVLKTVRIPYLLK